MGSHGTSNRRIVISICDSFTADDDSFSRSTKRSTYQRDLENLFRLIYFKSCRWTFLNIFLLITEPMFWFNHCQNLLWIRNHIVAPLSEEFTFRACMLPLLLQSFSPITSIFITPLFFGVGMYACLNWNRR